MALVFLSYDRADAMIAGAIAASLEKAGHEVWWDRRIKGGEEYSEEIEQALTAADAVVVLWSKESVKSSWVRDEAGSGRDRGRLIPLSLAATAPPLGFRQFQSIELGGWQGRGRVPQLKEILAAIDRGSKEVALDVPVVSQVPRAYARWPAPRSALVALAFGSILLIVGLIIARPWQFATASPATVEIAPADSSVVSKSLAQDVLAQLGQFQSARPDALRLVSANGDEPAAWRLEVAAATEGSQSQANLVLLDSGAEELLWSRSFERPTRQAGDLRQQLGYTAAQVLQCAAKARPNDHATLRSSSVKLYLNSCAALADKADDNLLPLISQLRRLTETEPKFADGWAKLLLVESGYTRMLYRDEASGIIDSLPAHIKAARTVDPKLPEAFLAEALSLPDREFARRMALLQKATENDPNNAPVLGILSDQLRLVGRMEDSIQAAQRAVQADPLSPTIRRSLVEALMYAGKFDAARTELSRLERIWPGASNVTSARFALDLRYGDPKKAQRSVQSGELGAAMPSYIESFLRARIDPTPANIDHAIRDAQSWYKQAPTSIYHFVQVLGTFDRNDQLFDILSTWPHPDKIDYVLDGLFRPALTNFHRDPRMMIVAKRLGLLDYWRATGKWPDFCSDLALPYNCRAEAAKLG